MDMVSKDVKEITTAQNINNRLISLLHNQSCASDMISTYVTNNKIIENEQKTTAGRK
jgi:acyl CoA:acetate/3-ketoacid CoA transferase alpha subunit